MELIIPFNFSRAAILGFDVTALPYYFKQKNLSFPTIETTQWRHEIQDGGAREIQKPKSLLFIIIKCYISLV